MFEKILFAILILMIKFAIFDRDGVINIDHGHVGSADRFDFHIGIFRLMRHIQCSHKIVIFTNQAGIAKKKYMLSDFFKTNAFMLETLEKADISVFHIFWCPHFVNASASVFDLDCNCRKPKSGMLSQLSQITEIDLDCSFVIGDNATDIAAGKEFGIENGYLVNFDLKPHSKGLTSVGQLHAKLILDGVLF